MDKIHTGEIHIGEFVFDREKSVLKSADVSIRLEPLSFAFLCYLVVKQGQIVSREELLCNVWDNRVVSDDSIRKVVKKLREAFQDNARDPSYIRTIPMKGYCLVAKVIETPANDVVVRHWKQRVPTFVLAISVICIMAVLMVAFFPQDNSVPAQSSARDIPHIELLTRLSGSEVNGDYSQQLDLLLFVHRLNNSDPWQLYQKNLSNGFVSRFTWDNLSYRNVLFSPDSKHVAFEWTDKLIKGISIANFDHENGLSNIRNINNTASTFLQSWSADGKSLYVTGANESGDAFALYKTDIASKKLQQLTFYNTEGMGDYVAQESPDGKYLAVLRNVSDRKYAMLILETDSKKVLVKKPITFFASSIVWLSDNEGVAISSFKGDFYYYSLVNDQLTEQKGSTPGINDVFYHCGEKCFYMRQHTMNYTDIQEIPNPFLGSISVPILHIESDNAEFNPLYNSRADTLYYTSKGTTQANLIRHALGAEPEVLYSFNPRYIVNNLSVNPQESKLLGKIEDRIFILDLTSKELTYVTSTLEIVCNPEWNLSGDSLYFSRVEQHKSVLQQYTIATGALTRLEQGIVSRKELADGRVFIIDDQNAMYQIMPDSKRRFIIELPNTAKNHWQIVDNHLYFSQHDGNDFYLHRLNLTTGHQDGRLLSENTWQKGFYIHPNGKKILITQSLLADSNLVKIVW